MSIELQRNADRYEPRSNSNDKKQNREILSLTSYKLQKYAENVT